MTAPHVQPIIDSLEDIPKVPGLFVTVNRGQDLEAILMVVFKNNMICIIQCN